MTLYDALDTLIEKMDQKKLNSASIRGYVGGGSMAWELQLTVGKSFDDLPSLKDKVVEAWHE